MLTELRFNVIYSLVETFEIVFLESNSHGPVSMVNIDRLQCEIE